MVLESTKRLAMDTEGALSLFMGVQFRNLVLFRRQTKKRQITLLRLLQTDLAIKYFCIFFKELAKCFILHLYIALKYILIKPIKFP